MVRCSSAMPLQHHSAFTHALYSPHDDYLFNNVLVYSHKYVVNNSSNFVNDERHSHYPSHHPNHYSFSAYSPPRIKQEDFSVYLVSSYTSPHEQQLHENYGLDDHCHDSSQPFALFEGHYSIPSHSQPVHPSHPTYYSPPFQTRPQQQPQEIPSSSFSHQLTNQSIAFYTVYDHPAEVSPSVESLHTSWPDDEPGIVEDMDLSTTGVISGTEIVALTEETAVEGNEEDAEGEEDWGHISPHDTIEAKDPNDPTKRTDSVAPALSEEVVSAASPTSSDKDFEELTSEEVDDDDDEEFLLNPRQQQRSWRRLDGTASTSDTTDASSRSVPYSITEQRSLRSISTSGRYNPYPGYFPKQVSFSDDLEDCEEDMKPTISGWRRSRPVPVPNLIKKSRGRRVPTMSSLEEIRNAASGAGKKRKSAAGKSARMYLCDIEGCGKCFARGEHLNRHVRSIHTYEKPHKCPYPGCGKHFSRHDNLGQHMRVHKD